MKLLSIIIIIISLIAIIVSIVFGFVSYENSSWPVSLFLVGMLVMCIGMFMIITVGVQEENSIIRSDTNKAVEAVLDSNMSPEDKSLLLKLLE